MTARRPLLTWKHFSFLAGLTIVFVLLIALIAGVHISTPVILGFFYIVCFLIGAPASDILDLLKRDRNTKP